MQTVIKTMRIRYQPIIRFADMRADSAEVLVRSVRPDGEVAGPEAILEAMTGTESSMTLTSAILQCAADEYVAFGFGSLGLSFAVNLPLDAMQHPDLIAIIESIRIKAKIPLQKISFELTERHPVTDIFRAGAIITVLRAAGYHLTLDDITPGMTNLAALLDLPIQGFKLDRSITTSTAEADVDFIRQVAARGRAGGHVVIAEGIETGETLQRMRDLGVTHGQGYLFSQALPAAALERFLGDWAQRKPA